MTIAKENGCDIIMGKYRGGYICEFLLLRGQGIKIEEKSEYENKIKSIIAIFQERFDYFKIILWKMFLGL